MLFKTDMYHAITFRLFALPARAPLAPARFTQPPV